MFLNLVCSVLLGLLAADEPPPVTWDSLEARMKWEADHGFSGVVLVARDGQVVLHRAYGLAMHESAEKTELDDRMLISIAAQARQGKRSSRPAQLRSPRCAARSARTDGGSPRQEKPE